MISSTTVYRQCHLQKGNLHRMSWIPDRFAVVGGVVKVKEGNQWDDGWMVKEAFARLDEDQLLDPHESLKAIMR